ncbi:MAG: heparinase II/III family protein [Pseudomonadota bacterium]
MGERPTTALSGLLALAGRRVVHSAVEGAAALWQRQLAGTPSRILFAPETLHVCDPEKAADIYAGVFELAGTTVDAAGDSPFAVPPPSPEWARELHSFDWLVHLEANATALSSTNARALIEEWLAAKSANGAMAQSPAVVADRLTAWLVQSPLLLEGASAPFRLLFMRAIGKHIRRLERVSGRLPHSVEKAKVLATLALAGTVIAEQSRLQRWALAVLGDTLAHQVLADGGHASRSPGTLLALAAPLVVLRDAIERRQQPIPPAIGGTIDKVLPMLRFFCNGVGPPAAFHGTGALSAADVAAVTAFDDTNGTASDNARYSGYQRIQAGSTVVLMDTGKAPPPEFATAACASALAFELSHDGARIIGSCGALGDAQPDWAPAARATAAQSTLTLADKSSARVLNLWPLTAVLGLALYRGPREVTVTRDGQREREGQTVRAAHDGYRDEFGVVHERTLTLSPDGLWLDGTDRIMGEGKLAAAPFAVRFHLAPGLKIRLDKARRNAMLRLADGAIWLFAVDEGPPLELEESVMLVHPKTIRRTAQIVINCNTLTDDTVRWHIARHASPLGDVPRLESP